MATERGLTVNELAHALAGDLEWIVHRAIARDPAERYQSMGHLLEDLNAYLALRPVTARPPSLGYVVRRFIRRNRAAVSFAFLAALATLVGIGATAYGLVQAEQARAEAEREANSAQQVTDFLVGLFTRSDPTAASAGQLTVPELLNSAAADIERREVEDPVVRATIETTIGRVFLSRGDAARALTLSEAALGRLPAEASEERWFTASVIVDALLELGRFDDAQARFTTALAERDAPLENEDLRRRANVRYGLNNFRGSLEDLLDADKLLRADADADPAHQAELALHVAVMYSELGELDSSLAWGKQAITRFDTLYGPVHPASAIARQNTAINLRKLGRYDEAQALYGEALAVFREIYDGDHPMIANALNNQSRALAGAGKLTTAVEVAEESLTMYRRLFGPAHTKVAIVMSNLGDYRRQQLQFAAAEDLHRRALEMQRQHLRDGSVGVADIELSLGRDLLKADRATEAATALESAAGKYAAALGETARRTQLAHAFLAEALALTNQPARARVLFQASLPALQDHPALTPAQLKRWQQLRRGVTSGVQTAP